MDIQPEVAFRNMDRSDAVEAKVRERIQKLERFFDRINSCRVVIEAPHRHQHKGKHYHVRIEVGVPGKDIVVSRDPGALQKHEDVYVAVRDAFDACERRLDDHSRRLRREVKTHENPPHGTVARLFPEQDYGFVQTADGREVYFHRNAVSNGGFDKLEAGAEVRISVIEGESADGPQCTLVQPIGKHHIVE